MNDNLTIKIIRHVALSPALKAGLTLKLSSRA